MKNRIGIIILLLLMVYNRAAATITITGPGTPCLGSSGLVYTSDDGGGGTWSSSNSSRISIDATTGIAATGVLGTAVISYIPSPCIGCSPAVKIVTVSPVPNDIRVPGVNGSPELAPAITLCVGSTTRLISNLSNISTWSSTDPSVASINGTTHILEGVSAGSVTISYVTNAGCFVTSSITVPTVISGKSITGTGAVPVVVCESQSLQLITDATAGGTWSSADKSIATIGSSTGIVLGGVTTGDDIQYTNIQYVNADGCVTKMVTVNPKPTPITGTAKICLGTTAQLFNGVAGGTWSNNVSGHVTVNATTGVVTAVNVGSTRVSYILANGCSANRIQTVVPTVSGSIAPVSPYPSMSVCSGSTVPLEIIGDSLGTWTTTDTTIATIDDSTGIARGIVYSMSDQTTFVQYINSSGCVVGVLTVNAVPPNITGTLVVCQGSTTTLSDASGGGTWSSGNTSIATVGSSSGVVTGVAAGTATITYTAATGCITTAVVTVNPLPGDISGPSTFCAGATAAYSYDGAGTWSSSNTGIATIGTAGNATGISGGTVTISFTLATGCGVATKNVTVIAAPAIFDADVPFCQGSDHTVFASPLSGTWSSGNTSIVTAGSTFVSGGLQACILSGIAAGTAVISYTAPSGCISTAIVTVLPLPATITGLTVCAGASATLMDGTAGGTWSSDAIAIGSSTGIVSPGTGASGTAIVTYTLPTGCSITGVLTINSYPAISGTGVVCKDSTITLTDAIGGGTWSSSNTVNGTVDASGKVTGLAVGTTTISYTLENGCFAVKTITIVDCSGRYADGDPFDGNEHQYYSLAPNPGNGNINITQGVASDTRAGIKVMNAMGQVVYNATVSFKNGQSSIAVGNVADGTYLLQLTDEDGSTHTFRIVIQQ